jgi:hypothetical protein
MVEANLGLDDGGEYGFDTGMHRHIINLLDLTDQI